MLNSQQLLSLCIIADLLVILLFLTLIVVSYFHTWKTMKHLNAMLDAAINGSFQEMHMDESMLSSLESKFAAYLSAQETASMHVAEEKNTIKELISDISHQTKTPIANIMLYTELLSEQEQLISPQGRDYLTALHTQTEKLNFLISSLIKMSRLETDVFVLHPVPTPILPVLVEVIRQLAPKAQAKGLRMFLPFDSPNTSGNTHTHNVSASLGPDTIFTADTLSDTVNACAQSADLTAVFDPKWTQEALFNLVDNAVKYTKQGSITIDVTLFELFCRITITDTGIGIAEEEHAKIFSRFYRSAQVSEQEGVGIGLYLTREIISRQGGYLKLTSAPDEGSSFAVYLPR
ncbi:MAG: HAMP domain-containing histidine kinase [Lachnospiraceae bacterium]|nr:HAMP domain-containing histidine kinase [Lachnospiraceae bacterium]